MQGKRQTCKRSSRYTTRAIPILSLHLSCKQQKCQAVSKINQSIGQSLEPPVNQSINQPINPSINQQINKTIDQLWNSCIHSHINQITSQWTNQTTDQSIEITAKFSDKCQKMCRLRYSAKKRSAFCIQETLKADTAKIKVFIDRRS